MSEAAIHDYLTKQITINRNIVTFRLLSRAFSIHVNVAKKALESFYQQTKIDTSSDSIRLHATYFISGQPRISPFPAVSDYGDQMDVDGAGIGVAAIDEPSKVADYDIPVRKILVVPEEELLAAKAGFSKIDSMHCYSLAPSVVRDPALLVNTVDAVRKSDAKRSSQELQKLGVAVDLTLKTSINLKARAKPTETITAGTKTKQNLVSAAESTNSSTSAPAKPADSGKPAMTNKTNKPEPKAATTSKAKGTLDWSKAKSKVKEEPKSKPKEEPTKLVKKAVDEPQKTEKRALEDKNGKKNALSTSNSATKPYVKSKLSNIMDLVDEDDEEEESPMLKSTTSNVKKAPSPASVSVTSTSAAPKRGIKRPSPPSDDEEDEVSKPPKTKPRRSAPEPAVKAKNGVLLSDEEDDEEVPPKKVAKRRVKSDAVMRDDWSDDEDVVKVRDSNNSKNKAKGKPRTLLDDDEDGDEDEEMDDIGLPDENDMEIDQPTQEENEEDPIYAKKVVKKKRVWPVGSNGLRKRRVIKDVETIDEKGYMVIESVSDYESVADESEEPSIEETKKAHAKKTKAEIEAIIDPTKSQSQQKKAPKKSQEIVRPETPASDTETKPASLKKEPIASTTKPTRRQSTPMNKTSSQNKTIEKKAPVLKKQGSSAASNGQQSLLGLWSKK